MKGRKPVILIAAVMVLSGCVMKAAKTTGTEENQIVQHRPVVIKQEDESMDLYELAVSHLGYSEETKSWVAGDGATLSHMLPNVAGDLPRIMWEKDLTVEFPETVTFCYMRIFDEQYEKVDSLFTGTDEENKGETPSEICGNALKELSRGTYYISIAVVEDGRYVKSEEKNEYTVYEYSFRLDKDIVP